MQTVQLNSLLWDNLNYSVPATIEEYNGLAPKRVNPVLEDANADIIKHKVLTQFRNRVLDAFEKAYGVKRKNFGTEKAPQWEKDLSFCNRVMAEVLESRGQSAADPNAVKEFISETLPTAQEVIRQIPFVVAEREPGQGPSLSKLYVEMATQAVGSGKAERLAALLSSALNRVVAVVGDTEKDVETLARAISDNEKRKRDIQLAAAKAEYGLSE